MRVKHFAPGLFSSSHWVWNREISPENTENIYFIIFNIFLYFIINLHILSLGTPTQNLGLFFLVSVDFPRTLVQRFAVKYHSH